MREIFTPSGISTRENNNGDHIVTITLKTTIGPGYLLDIVQKFAPYSRRECSVNFQLIQSAINTETGEVVE